ncbi:condensation domain-containing protein [Micromonospora sp. DR5-3]|uniref:condensation domain-containing protein n=1 Tax=unclassified Micromonospora TaxID=2617518 RepID=UPI0021028820|nr:MULTISPECIES: condensation domain-containing protein [unclassified Micromonospora]MCW3818828.1 condensation domain-containing protein [Micromonospora sp. DR5-3]
MTLTSTAAPTEHDQSTMLAGIWAELLGVDPDALPRDVSFLRLGGDSVLAVRMSALVRRRLGVQLALSDVRVDTTFTELAALVASRAAGTTTGDRPLPVDLRRRADPATPFTLLPLQQGYFVGQQDGWELSYDSAHYYLDLALTDVDPDEAPEALRDALQRLAAHQPTLRARVTPEGHQHVLALEHPGAVPPLHVLDLRDDPDSDARLEVLRREMSTHGPDPTRGPGVDVRLSLLPAGRGRLHLSLSLLLVDGWSSNVLTRELLTLAADVNATLPALDVNFGDYVNALEQLPATTGWRADQKWWRAQLPSWPPAPALPLTRDPAEATPQVMANREARLPAAVWTALRQRCAEQGLTPSVALLTVYATVLARWAGHHRLLLNTLQLNRLPLHPDVHRLVGAFASTMLLPVDLPPGGSFAELAGQTQRRFAEHTAHNLVSGVEIARDLARLRGTHRPVAPVVFLSTIGMDAAMGERAPRHAGPLGEVNAADHHHQLRTPQVALEARLFELDDELALVFSTVAEILSAEQVDRAFAEFVDQAAALAEADAWHEAVPLPAAPDPDPLAGGLRLGLLDEAPQASDDEPGPPRDRVEEQIAAVFADLLGVAVTDRTTSFFALGGDSLLAVRALARLARAGLAGVTVRDFLAAPTVAGLAAAARPTPTQ